MSFNKNSSFVSLNRINMEKLLGFLLLTLICIGCKSETEDTILYLVRHAEKDTTVQSDNPPLIQEGIERAERLEEIMYKYELNEIYSTAYDRNMNTVQGVADQQGLEIKNYEWHEWHESIDAIKKQKGIFLLCGHGDNLLPMIDYLNAEKPMDHLGHDEYENLFRVIIAKDTAYVDLIRF